MLHQQADVWLLDEPTRGIDVGTKAEIYQLIGELAARGTTILLVSSYFPELLQLCDRIAVLARGRLVDLRPAADWNEHELMLAAMGSDQGPTSPAATDGNRLPVDHPARLNHA
jgi:ribose transport system ATP-binding protein